MGPNLSATVLAVPPTPVGEGSTLLASFDRVAQCLGHADWASLRASNEDLPARRELPPPPPALSRAVSLLFAQDRTLTALRYPVALAAEHAQIAHGVAVVGTPDLRLPPCRRGMASVEFRRELLGEAYALQRLRRLRGRYEPADLREWVDGYAALPGCWKTAAEPGATVESVVVLAEAVGIMPEMVWLDGIGYDVVHGIVAVAELPSLPAGLA